MINRQLLSLYQSLKSRPDDARRKQVELINVNIFRCVSSTTAFEASYAFWATSEPTGGVEKCVSYTLVGGTTFEVSDRLCSEQHRFACEVGIKKT